MPNEISHKGPYILWFILYKMSRIGKSTDRKYYLSRALDELEGKQKVIDNGYSISWWGHENVLKLVVMTATQLWKYLKPLNHIF